MADPHPSVRDATRRSPTGSAARGSCDLLLTLCTRDPVAQLLGEACIGPGQLLEAREDLEAVLGPEPADWRVRLADRGGSDGDLDLLLAICRSADSHAYQLLEQLGVCCATLRRKVIERLRDEGIASVRGAVSIVARPPPATMSRTRRSAALARPATVRTVRTPRQKGGPIASPDPRNAGAGRDKASPRRDAHRSDAGTGSESEVASSPDAARPRRGIEPGAQGGPRRELVPRKIDPLVEATAMRGLAATSSELGAQDPTRRRPTPDEDAVGSPAGNTRRAQAHAAGNRAAEGARAPAMGPELRRRRVDRKRLAPLHGRERELGQIADAIGRRRIRVPLLVGPPGCGRTLLARHLASLFDDPVYHLEATAYDDEQSLADDLAAIDRERGIIVFDDLDRVPSEAAPPFLGALSHAFTIGQPRILTIISPEGHGRLGNWLPGALESADAIRVDPLHGPPLEAAVRAAAPGVLADHGLSLASDAKLGELTRWAERHLTGLAMPARALDLLDLACARTARRGGTEVTRQVWLDIVGERSGLTPARIEARGDHEILDLEQRLARSVVGHAKVTSAVASLVRRNRAGFGGQRPVLTALLLGPSGVGKTELAKALAHALFDRDDALLRLDMSEYAESHAVARIIGAPPGYIGHEHGGALSDPLLRRPHCVVLLDEIEKAHRDVHQLLLQVFDDGRLTDGRGRTVDFRHAAIIMTSNLGADRIERGRDGPVMDDAEVLDVARAAFPVELWNRIEAPLVMQPLTPDDMARICRRLAAASSDRLFKERGIRYALSDDACTHLVRLAGGDPSLGARPLRHLLVREVESVIADAILRGQLRAGSQVSVELERGRIALR
jgi:ATP-dependent Clp protease ATP-binding subunit ClpC